MTKVFKDHYASPKQTTRDYLFDQLRYLRKYKPKLLTLPADNFIFERMVLKQYPFAKIDCREYDINIFNKAKSIAPKQLKYEYGDIFDKLHDCPNTYDLVWIDLCGNLSFSNINNLLSVVQNTLKENSVLAFTFTAGRELNMSYILDVYSCKDPKEFRFVKFPQIIINAAKLSHSNFHLDNIIRYKNNKNNSTPMCMLVFKTQ